MQVLSLESVFVYIKLQNREEKILCHIHFKIASLVFRLDLLPPRYLSADNDNDVRLHNTYIRKLCQKMVDFREEKKSSK